MRNSHQFTEPGRPRWRAGGSAYASGIAIEQDERAVEHLKHPCVLLAEDDEELRELLDATLRRYAINVIPVEDGVEALSYMDVSFKHPLDYPTPDLIVSDVRMPQCDGLDVLAYAAMWRVPTILITAFSSPELVLEANNLGAIACIDKPFDITRLCDVVVDYVR